MEASEAVDGYLNALPTDQLEALQRLRSTIAELVPDAVEAISYGMPAFKWRNRPLVGYSASKGHLALHPMSGSVIGSVADLLGDWQTSKGTVRFQPAHPISTPAIAALLAARMRELTGSPKGNPVSASKPAATKPAATKPTVGGSGPGGGSSFTSTLLQAEGMKATGIVVPPHVIEALGRGKKPPVNVTLNGHTFRTTIGVMNGNAMIGVSAEIRKTTGLTAGDDVDVILELADAPREVAVPDDLASAMNAQPAAAAFFATLSNSLQRFHIDNVNGAKTAETRVRRIEKAVQLFLAGKQR